MTVPRNNPGNLRFVMSIHWRGQVGQDGGFCVFDQLFNGARALCIDLKNAQFLHRLNTVEQIIPYYAPPKENDTESYIAAVCVEMGVHRNDVLNLQTKGPLEALAGAVWHHEQGQKPDTNALDYGVSAALGSA
jgi:hypothetical protein